MLVVFVSKRAKPVAPPATQKLAASDTMNDGRPVRTVMIPLISPTHAPEKKHDGDYQPERYIEDCGADREKDRGGADNGADRKVGFSRHHEEPTGIAIMPSSAEVSSQPAVPSIDTKPAPCVVIAKKR